MVEGADPTLVLVELSNPSVVVGDDEPLSPSVVAGEDDPVAFEPVVLVVVEASEPSPAPASTTSNSVSMPWLKWGGPS